MLRQECFARIHERLAVLLPEGLRGFQTKTTGSLTKVYYRGDMRIHYEVWFQSGKGRVELGLHFEGRQPKNDLLLDYFSERFVEVIAALGSSVEPEKWTKSWARIHQSIPLAPCDERLADTIAVRLAAMIEVLEPMLTEALAAM